MGMFEMNPLKRNTGKPADTRETPFSRNSPNNRKRSRESVE